MVVTNYLSPKAAAAQACCSVTLVYQWVAAGTLPAYRVGAPGKRGKILIAPADLHATLESFKSGGRPATPPPPSPAPLPPAPPRLRHLRLD